MHTNRNTIPTQWRIGQRPFVSTAVAAEIFGVQPHTLRVALCRHGAYCGITPVKGPNRFLLWPTDQIERAIRGEAV